MSDSLQELISKAMTEGFTIYGPTEPVRSWGLPRWEESQTPHWKALWQIAILGPDEDDRAYEIAAAAIGEEVWPPGPKPGWVPSLIDRIRADLYRPNPLFDRTGSTA
jgi:hypothetical protein